MSRHHCHSARHGMWPSNCALSNNERHRGCQKRSHTNIYTLFHNLPRRCRCQQHVPGSPLTSGILSWSRQGCTLNLFLLSSILIVWGNITLFASSSSPSTFANCHQSPVLLKEMCESMMSDEYMSGPRLGSHLSLCPGGTYTSPADRACDCFAICTRYARYFAFSRQLVRLTRPKTLHHIAVLLPNLAPFPRNALPHPPPPRKTSSGVAVSPPKAFSRPLEALASPSKLESDDVRRFEGWIPLAPTKWHRGPKGRSGDTWAGDLLRWLAEGGAAGRRRSRLRSSICALS